MLDQALQTLNDMLRDQVEFNVTVQAIDVRQPQPGNSKGTIRFRPPAVIHRRSLKAREVAPAALQPSPRWVPWVVGATASSPANVNLYLAPRFAGTASVWIAFPQAYSDLVAQFPTASGFVPVPQSGPAVLWDTVYLVNFAYPAGVSGFTVGIQRTVPGASSQPMPEPVTPIGDFGGAAVVWPYDYQPGLHWPQWI